jgi:prefoldin subunit 5
VIRVANEEFQKVATEYEMLRSQLEALAQQNELLTMSLEEHMRAKETMTRFQKGGKGSEILVPVGANAFLFVEEDIGEAMKRLDGKIEDLNTALKSLAEKIVEVSQKAEEKSEIVRTLYAQSQQGTE